LRRGSRWIIREPRAFACTTLPGAPTRRPGALFLYIYFVALSPARLVEDRPRLFLFFSSAGSLRLPPQPCDQRREIDRDRQGDGGGDDQREDCGAHGALRHRERDSCHRRFSRTVMPFLCAESHVTVGPSGPFRIRRPWRSLRLLRRVHSRSDKQASSGNRLRSRKNLRRAASLRARPYGGPRRWPCVCFWAWTWPWPWGAAAPVAARSAAARVPRPELSAWHCALRAVSAPARIRGETCYTNGACIRLAGPDASGVAVNLSLPQAESGRKTPYADCGGRTSTLRSPPSTKVRRWSSHIANAAFS